MWGSSPLTRGKREAEADDCVIGGAHPRSRGENVAGRRITRGERGSSPLTRGKQHGGDKPLATALAHPRSRGENVS